MRDCVNGHLQMVLVASVKARCSVSQSLSPLQMFPLSGTDSVGITSIRILSSHFPFMFSPLVSSVSLSFPLVSYLPLGLS